MVAVRPCDFPRPQNDHEFVGNKLGVSYRETASYITTNYQLHYDKLYSMTFPDFTRHFFSSLAETVDGSFVVVLNR